MVRLQNVGAPVKLSAWSIAMVLLLAACQARETSGASMAIQDRRAADSRTDQGIDAINNILSAGDEPQNYGTFEPTLRPSLASAANTLQKPPAYRKAIFGYFDDPDILRQFTAKQRAAMRVDGNGFDAKADLDGDGAIESYRTGYFQMPDGKIGLFLAAFEQGKQVGLWTENDALWNILWISTRGGLTLFHCNCPEAGTVSFNGKRLRVNWAE